MQKAHRQAFLLRGIALRSLVGMWFQVHYPPLEGVLPIFRSRYWFAIGRQRVLSLARWTSQIRAYFHVSGSTQVPDRPLSPAAYGTITLCGRTFQNDSAKGSFVDSLPLKAAWPYNPTGTCPDGLG